MNGEMIKEEQNDEESLSEEMLQEDRNDEEELSEPAKPSKKFYHSNKFLYLLAFFIPFLLMGITFAIMGIYPFGDHQVMVVDAWHQYYPFLAELQTKLKTGGSLIYSWNIGMGSNFLSIMAYYLISPLNFLTIFFPASILQELFALFILIKLGVAGVCCAFCLNKICRKTSHMVVLFSTFYALCGWVLVYYWNTMWLDSFAILPLVALGIHQLVTQKKFKLYTISLALSILFNYYIGLMICIFTALFFFTQCIAEKYTWKEFLIRLRNIIVYSCIALMVSAISLIPTLSTLGNAYKQTLDPFKVSLHSGHIENFTTMMAYNNAPSMGEFPNLYSGVLCILFLFAFYRIRSITTREKLAYTLLLFVMYVSTCSHLLNYLWHGLHVTNSLPFRYTFLFSFVLVLLGYKLYLHIEELKFRDYVCTVLLTAVFVLAAILAQVFVFASKTPTVPLTLTSLVKDFPNLWFLLVNVVLIAAYLLILLLFMKKKLRKKGFLILLVFVAALELVPSVLIELDGRTSGRDYPKVPEQMSEALTIIQEDKDFYRTELARRFTSNPASIYDYHGITSFTSTLNTSVSSYLKNMKLIAQPAGNSYYYQDTSPVTNLFLNLKYLLSMDHDILNPGYFTKLYTSEEPVLYAYRNEYWLPLGFMVKPELANFEFNQATPFETQNAFIRVATGMEEPVFTFLDIVHVGHNNLTVTRPAYGNYDYVPAADGNIEEVGSLKYNYQLPNDASVYAYLDIPKVKSANVLFGEKSIPYDITQPNIFPAGTYKTGDIFSLTAEVEAGKSGKLYAYVAMLNDDVFKRAYDLLADETLHVSSYSEKEIKGSITVKEDGLCYTSIPYEAGWKVYVDGTPVEITMFQDAMISIPLQPGTHEITLVYSPTHVYASFGITILGILLFAGCSLLDYKRRRTEKNGLLLPFQNRD